MSKAFCANKWLTATCSILPLPSPPDWLTVGTRSESNPEAVTINRTAVAFEFCLHVSGGGRTHELQGVYSWAAWHLDGSGEANQQVWFDIGGTLAEFGKDGALLERLNQGAAA